MENFKKIVGACCVGSLLCLVLMQAYKLNDITKFAQAFSEMGTLHAATKGETDEPALATGFFSREQRVQRLKELQNRLDEKPVLEAQETREIVIDFILMRSADVLQGLADAVGDRIAEKDKNAGEGLKRLPGALSESVYGLYLASKVILTKEYIENIKTLLSSVRCLKTAGKDSGECKEYSTITKQIAALSKDLSKVMRPLMDVLLLDRAVNDAMTGEKRILKGVIPIATGLIAHDTEFQKNVEKIMWLVGLLFDIADNIDELSVSAEKVKSGDKPVVPIDDVKLNKINNDVNTFQTWAAFVREFTPLIKDEYKIGAIKVPGQLTREVIQTSVDASYNMAELVRTVAKIVNQQAPEIERLVACLQIPEGQMANNAQCVAVGCKDRKQCLAKIILNLTDIVGKIFGDAIAKYNVSTNTTHRGLLMNLDHLLEKTMQSLLANPTFKNYLNSKKVIIYKKEVTLLSQFELFAKRLESLSTVSAYLAEAVTDSLNGLNAAAVALTTYGGPAAKR